MTANMYLDTNASPDRLVNYFFFVVFFFSPHQEFFDYCIFSLPQCKHGRDEEKTAVEWLGGNM